MREWSEGNGSLQLLLAAASHHGKLLNIEATHRFDSRLWSSDGARDPLAEMSRAAKHLRSVFPLAYRPAPPLPATPALHHAFAGVVMLSDWLGSDTRLFRYTKPGDGPREQFAREQAARGLQEMGLNATCARTALSGHSISINTISSHTQPRAAQAEVAAVDLAYGGDVLILEAETGAGKTEAALLRFLHLLQAGEVDGMYFALPTRTAATQIHRRVQLAVERAFPNQEQRPPVVLAVPGYLQVDDQQGVRLPHFRVLWSDDARWRYRGWAAEHPKRYLAGAVVVGTIDQVLLSALKVNHAHLRASSLLRHLLVIDEVHASDAYMNRLLEEVLRHHRAAGGHALLMSATLGLDAQQRLLWPDQGPKTPPLPPLSKACRAPYPALRQLRLAAPNAAPMKPLAADNGKSVQTVLRSWQDDHHRIADQALQSAASGARVLIIRNTVRGCLQTQRALEELSSQRAEAHLLMRCAGLAVPHHSRYARPDRIRLDDTIETVFRGDGRSGVVAVATQTVQQSLDLDADLLITDLCPMDVLLQRIGRLHRHQNTTARSRPGGFETAKTIVLVPDKTLASCLRADGAATGPHGIGTVYGNLCILQATLEELQKQPLLLIPQQSRARVEQTTHREALQQLAERLGTRWLAHLQKLKGLLFAHKGVASRSCVPWNAEIGTRTATFDRELDGDVVTRLGERDRRVQFDSPLLSPFGERLRELTIPHWMAPHTDEDVLQPEDIEVHSTGFDFRLLDRHYQYTRLGLASRKDAS